MDLTTLTDEELGDLRISVLTEQERRSKIEQLPERIADMTRDAIQAGCDPADLRTEFDAALE